MWDLRSPTRDRTGVPCIAWRILYHWTTREVPFTTNSCISRWTWSKAKSEAVAGHIQGSAGNHTALLFWGPCILITYSYSRGGSWVSAEHFEHRDPILPERCQVQWVTRWTRSYEVHQKWGIRREAGSDCVSPGAFRSLLTELSMARFRASCIQSINSAQVLLSLPLYHHWNWLLNHTLKRINSRSWHLWKWKKSLEKSADFAKKNTARRVSFFAMMNQGVCLWTYHLIDSRWN